MADPLFEYEGNDTLIVEKWSDRTDDPQDANKLLIEMLLWDHGSGFVIMDNALVIDLRDVLNEWLEGEKK